MERIEMYTRLIASEALQGVGKTGIVGRRTHLPVVSASRWRAGPTGGNGEGEAGRGGGVLTRTHCFTNSVPYL